MSIILVTGGRNYTDVDRVDVTLTDLSPSLVIHGDAKGADALAKQWCLLNNVPQEAHPADWAKHGKTAGPIRNQTMLARKPDLVVAFPGGRGTAHMVGLARKAGIQVLEIP